MLCIILAVIILGLIYHLLRRPFNYWTEKGVPQGDPVILFGDQKEPVLKTRSFAETSVDIYNKWPGLRYSGIYQFYSPTLVVRDPELIKQLTVKDFDYFTDHRPLIPPEGDPLWGKNLVALRGQPWRDMRATLSPTFTSSKIKFMFNLINEAAESFVNYFKGLNQDTVDVELKDTFRRFTTDVIASTAFGINVDSLKDKENDFFVMGRLAMNFGAFLKSLKIFFYILIPRFFSYFKINFFEKEVSDFFIGLTNETLKVRQEKNITRPDMIHILMEARKGNQKPEVEDTAIDGGFAVVEESEIGKREIKRQLDDMDIAAQAMLFFFAGFDTVSSCMCFMGYELAVNPEVQNKLREEIREVLEECGGKVTYEAILKMQYMDQVVSEALRKWPPASISDRICTKPYTLKATQKGEVDVHLPVGTLVWLPILAIQRDPNNFPDPEKFDPERFSEENKSKIKPYTFLSFGAGPRGCIGSRFALLETKIVFFHLLNSFEIVPNEKSQIPLKICKKQFNVSAENGFEFSFKRLSKSF